MAVSYPHYYFRTVVLLAFGGLGFEVLTDYRFFVNFDRIPEPNLKAVLSFSGLNGAPSGVVKFRVGGVSIDTLDGTVIHTATVFGGLGLPQIVSVTVPKVWTGVMPFKMSGSSNNGQAVAMGSVTFTLMGMP